MVCVFILTFLNTAEGNINNIMTTIIIIRIISTTIITATFIVRDSIEDTQCTVLPSTTITGVEIATICPLLIMKKTFRGLPNEAIGQFKVKMVTFHSVAVIRDIPVPDLDNAVQKQVLLQQLIQIAALFQARVARSVAL